MNKKASLLSGILSLFIYFPTMGQGNQSNVLHPGLHEHTVVKGELKQRLLQNYSRLESEIYSTDAVFPVNKAGMSPEWPGDFEGRIILALTQAAKASHIEPKYLTDIIKRLPERFNKEGYLGPLRGDFILEQQLSGHGWLLKGLCEYYRWRPDPKVKKYITDIVRELAIPTKGKHVSYPIHPTQRQPVVGAPSGKTLSRVGAWDLSSDIGCDFIFMDGLVQAYKLFPDKELKSLVDEMASRFLQMDLRAVKAQTHATLTALRALLDLYEITGDRKLFEAAETRYALYHAVAITENYENFNWFDDPKWTEPCGITDAYLLAVRFWQLGGNPLYLETAHLIYYNALTHTQRSNGGFGLDNCPGPVSRVLSVYADEAYWCCSMRGMDGLSSAAQFTYFTGKSNLTLPFFFSADFKTNFNGKEVTVKQESSYPYYGKTNLVISTKEVPAACTLRLFFPSWAKNPMVKLNGKVLMHRLEKGFVNVDLNFRHTIQVEYTFDMQPLAYKPDNIYYTSKESYKIRYGALVLGYNGKEEVSFDSFPVINRKSKNLWTASEKNIELTPVFHLLDPLVSQGAGYNKQILFVKPGHSR